jgi:hypothetical protein
MMMRLLLLAVVMLVWVAPLPAAAVLTDDEPSNDAIGTAAVQIVPTAAVTTDGGEFTLTPAIFPAVPGDIDYLGIGSLAVGDIVTVSTTPLEDVLFDEPDTMIGLFNGGESRECEGDDSINNELDNPPGGRGSLCRFVIDSAGTWYVGVTGFSDPPFHGNHFESGVYELHVTINAIVVPPTPTPTAAPTSTATPTSTPTATSTPTPTPEPGVVLQLVSGGVGLAWLQRRRGRRVRARSRSRSRDDRSDGHPPGSASALRPNLVGTADDRCQECVS